MFGECATVMFMLVSWRLSKRLSMLLFRRSGGGVRSLKRYALKWEKRQREAVA